MLIIVHINGRARHHIGRTDGHKRLGHDLYIHACMHTHIDMETGHLVLRRWVTHEISKVQLIEVRMGFRSETGKS